MNYVETDTGRAYHESDAFVKIVVGPYGSGKTCMVAHDLLFYACAQPPAPDGVRYTRFGVIRATFPELIRTTRESLLEVFPRGYGTITRSTNNVWGLYRFPLKDGTTVQTELILQSLDQAGDTDKIRSANWTACFINEASTVDPSIFTEVMGRVTRYPTGEYGECGWGGVLIDSNQPEPGSWLDRVIKDPDPSYLVLIQPPAAFKVIDPVTNKAGYEVNPKAENLAHLGNPDPGEPRKSEMTPEQLVEVGMRYYRRQIDSNLKLGRTDKVDNLFCMLDVPIIEGQVVFPAFNRERHVLRHDPKPQSRTPVVMGFDSSGLHPAAVFLQEVDGQWVVLDELYLENEGLEPFLQQYVKPLLRGRYSDCDVHCSYDPANARDSYQGVAPSDRLREMGIRAHSPRTNEPKTRIFAVDKMLNLDFGGLRVAPRCELVTRAFQVDYRYRRIRASGTIGTVYTEKPEKNAASHLMDALQYACLFICRGERGELDGTEDRVVENLRRRRQVLGRAV